MNKKDAKYIASIIELFIFIWIAIFFITKFSTKYQIDDKKTKGLTDMFEDAITKQTQNIFGDHVGFLQPIFSSIGNIFKGFQNSINGVRTMMLPIREFMKQATEMFYMELSKYLIGVMYGFNKLRNAMRRSVSGFNLIFHTLEHMKNTMVSFVYSDEMKMTIEMIKPQLWISQNGSKLMCFDKRTKINMKNKNKKNIENIDIGDILEDENIVIGKQYFFFDDYLYNYRGIKVSGSHKVEEQGKWINVEDSHISFKELKKTEYIYCLTTSKSKILINNIKFKDFSESNNMNLNFIVNSILLAYLNKINSSKGNKTIAGSPKYLEHGFSGDIDIETSNGIKKIKDLKIGDLLSQNNKIIGLIKLDGKQFDYYSYNNIIISENMKVYEKGIWKSVEKSDEYIKLDIKLPYCYNIVSDNGQIIIGNHKFMDYLEVRDKYLNSEIDKILN